jgi:hypothetical protein
MSGRIALLGGVLVPCAAACADIWHFSDLQTGAAADATADSAAADETVGEVGAEESDASVDVGAEESDASVDVGAEESDASVDVRDSDGDADDAGPCADTQNDPSHCGRCGKACAAGASCLEGSCKCPSDQPTSCNNVCVDTATDHANCGGCGNLCSVAHAATSVCAGSTCSASSCASGYADCDKLAANGCEVDIARDPDNCGRCGSVCRLPHATAGCSAESCTIASCDDGFADCDEIALNGCETDLARPSSCGSCSVVCAGATPVCSASGCVSGCSPATPTLCNGTLCVDTTSDVSNCGACGSGCTLPHATPGCTHSNCVILECAAGYKDCDGLPANGCETHTGKDRSCGG